MESAIVAAMRPAILFPLFGEIRSLPGVGPRIEKLIERVAGTRLLDLIFDLPCGVIDRSYRPKLIEAEAGRIATVTLERARPPSAARPQAALQGALFRRHGDDRTRVLPRACGLSAEDAPQGEKRIVSGRIERFKSTLQMAHPDFIVEPGQEKDLPQHEAVYALTEGLPAKSLSKAIRAALEKVPAMPEWQDAAFRKSQGWEGFTAALPRTISGARSRSFAGDLRAAAPRL